MQSPACSALIIWTVSGHTSAQRRAQGDFQDFKVQFCEIKSTLINPEALGGSITHNHAAVYNPTPAAPTAIPSATRAQLSWESESISRGMGGIRALNTEETMRWRQMAALQPVRCWHGLSASTLWGKLSLSTALNSSAAEATSPDRM